MKSWTLLLASSKFTRDGLVSAPCARVRTAAAGNLRTEAGAGRSLAAAGSRSCVRSFSGGRGTTRLQINGDKEDTGLYFMFTEQHSLEQPEADAREEEGHGHGGHHGLGHGGHVAPRRRGRRHVPASCRHVAASSHVLQHVAQGPHLPGTGTKLTDC